jgi:tellurite resistance protein TerA
MRSTPNSQDSIQEANRYRVAKSAHGGVGAAGYISKYDGNQCSAFLSSPGQTAIVNPPAGGMPDFEIGVAWDNVVVEEERNFFKRLFKKKVQRLGVDLDLGCLYTLKDGSRGGMQAFGELHGALEEPPYICLTGDERRGDLAGLDEKIYVNGARWDEIEKIVVYVYIYGGAKNWSSVKPQIQVHVPGEQPMIVTLNARRSEMSVCAVAGIENVRGGIKLNSYIEYFPGQAEMDRAFGFGLNWEQGRKD